MTKEYIKQRIVHVDDSESNRYLVGRMLRKANFEVIEATTGSEGLTAALTHPDLIILDVKLPDIDGFEVCRRLRANPKTASIPVLYLSAEFVRGEDHVHGLEIGADGYLIHPLDPSMLIATINSILRIKQFERSLADSVQERDYLMAIVSHDLKTPLTSIDLTAQLLKRTLKQDGEIQIEKLTQKLDRILGSVHRMKDLIEDLLDRAKAKGNLSGEDKETQEIEVLVEEAIQSMLPVANEKLIRIKKENFSSQCKVVCNPARILQVLSNLLSNAVKFTPNQGEIRISLDYCQSEVVVSVTDTGPGISEEELPWIFDRFWQSQKTANLGTGIGLHIVKEIVEDHGGNVWVESQPGAGSSFYFSLPSAPQKETKLQKAG